MSGSVGDGVRTEPEHGLPPSLAGRLRRLWFLPVFLVTIAVVSSETVRWVMELLLGGATLAAGYAVAFRRASLDGYVFWGALRVIPYAILAAPLVALAVNRDRSFVWPIFLGGYLPTTGFIVFGYWETQRGFYTVGYMPPAASVNYLFIPILAVVPMALGVVVAVVVFALGRLLAERLRRRPT